MSIASTFFNSYRSAGLQELPRLTDREREAVVAAIDTGELVPIVDVQPVDGSGIVGVLAPEYVDRFCAERDAYALLDHLASLSDELDTLRQIVREVMAERSPGNFRDRIENCIDDAREILSRAENATEDL